MNRTVGKNKTLLIDGPASVMLVSGEVEVFGSLVKSMSRIVIREGKRLPFAAKETATVDISLGESAKAEEVDGNSIPPSWETSLGELRNLEMRPMCAVILGSVGSGKSSFCTFLINKLLAEKRKIFIIDGDLGQSDIGPPCTLSYSAVTKPLTDLFNLRAKNAFFVGATSPSGVIHKVFEGLCALKKEISGSDPDVVIVNTDGWTEGEDATYYKIRLVEELNPDIVFFIRGKDELVQVSNALEKFRRFSVDSPDALNQRGVEKRRSLRELGYIKYLRNARVQSFPFGWLRIEEDGSFGLNRTRVSMRYAKQIYQLLEMKPLHFTESKGRISIIIGRNRWINAENLKKVEEFTKKQARVVRRGEEAGLLVAACDSERRFLGIGVLQEIDYLKKSLKILTPVSEPISVLSFGEVKLDKNMKEIPLVREEEETEFRAFSRLF